MIDIDVSSKILTIGCSYKEPMGGVAQVLNTYSKSVYSDFQCVVNSGYKNKILNVGFGIWAMVKTFFILMFKCNIKILHIHTASNNSFKRSTYFVRLGKFMNRKVVLHMHGGGFKKYFQTDKFKIKKVLEECDYVVALTESWKIFFTENVELKNVVVINNIVPQPLLFKKESNVGKKHLLFLGLVNEEKGIFDLLEIIATNRAEFCDRIVLHIGGNGKIEKLQKMIKEYDIDNMVKYEGWVKGGGKRQLLSMADVYILPSYYEGLPISILEAMSYGLPIISTKVGGIPEVVEHGKNGLLFNPGDKEKLSEYLNLLIDNVDMRCRMGQESIKKIQPYLPENVEKSLTSLYKSLL